MAKPFIDLTKAIMSLGVTYVGGAQIRSPKSLHLRPRRIENFRFLYLESGQGEFRFPGETLSIAGGTLLLLAPGRRETLYKGSEPISYLYLEFHASRRLMEGPFLRCHSTGHFQTILSLMRSVHREKGKDCELLILAAVDLALRQPPDQSPGVDSRVQRALQYLEQHLDQPLQVADLAKMAGLSEPHFRRLFLMSQGVSPKTFLMRQRMLYARRILQTEGLQVSEVADLLHFETVFQFSNQYKKVLGNSPKQDCRQI